MWAGRAVTVFVLERTPHLMRMQQAMADAIEPFAEDFVKRLEAEPFEVFTATVEGVAIYQLGNFGTAAKKLWQRPATAPLS